MGHGRINKYEIKKKITSKYRHVRIKKKELNSHIEINGDHLYPVMGKRKHNICVPNDPTGKTDQKSRLQRKLFIEKKLFEFFTDQNHICYREMYFRSRIFYIK